MRIICFGDIHGRNVWKEVVDKEIDNTDLFIFLGDYFTSREGISEYEQILNFTDIVAFKQEYPDKVYLLRGNHDMEALYYWAECYPATGEFVKSFMRLNEERFQRDIELKANPNSKNEKRDAFIERLKKNIEIIIFLLSIKCKRSVTY